MRLNPRFRQHRDALAFQARQALENGGHKIALFDAQADLRHGWIKSASPKGR
jgi:hypothetical protein